MCRSLAVEHAAKRADLHKEGEDIWLQGLSTSKKAS